MRIVHGPKNIALVPINLAEAERELGYDSMAVTEWDAKWNFKSDLHLDALKRPENSTTRREFMRNRLFGYDVYHLHYGESMMGPNLPELPMLRAMGKTIFMHFHGCDLRDSKVMLKKYKYSFCTECWPMGCSANRSVALAATRRHADKVFVSTVDLMEFYEGSIWLPQAVDVKGLAQVTAHVPAPQPRAYTHDAPFLVAHAPSDPTKKGTHHIEAAVERMQADGLPVEMRRIEGYAHADAMAACAEADLVVDQIMAGTYGVFGIEMMAIGRPVVAYIRDDLRPKLPDDLPILSADPETIEAVLRAAMAGEHDLRELGERGRAYAARVHDRLEVAKITTRYYEAARARRQKGSNAHSDDLGRRDDRPSDPPAMPRAREAGRRDYNPFAKR